LVIFFLAAASSASAFQQEEATPEPPPEATPAASSPPASPPKSETDVLVKKLEEQIKLLQKQKQLELLEKDISAAKREQVEEEAKEFRARLPKSSVQALEGTVTVDNQFVIESEILSHKALDQISRKIGEELAGVTTDSLVIIGDRELADIQYYRLISNQISAASDAYTKMGLVGPAQEAGLTGLMLGGEAVSSLVKSAVDVASLFRTDTTITSLQIAIDNQALAAQVSNALVSSNRRVFYPAIFPPGLVTTEKIKIVSDISRLNFQKNLADQKINANEEADKPNLPTLKALNAQLTNFMSGLAVPDEQTKVTPLMSLIRGEYLTSMLVGDNDHLLHMKVVRAAGTNTTKRNLFTGTRLKHTGGVIITYMLFDRLGQIKKANTFFSYEGSEGNLRNNLR
jgi:hypothetical protein